MRVIDIDFINILLNKKSYKRYENILTYGILYKTYIGSKPLRIRFDDIDGFIIQPTYGIAEPSLDLLLKLYDVVYPHYEEVKVVPQLHKIIGAP